MEGPGCVSDLFIGTHVPFLEESIVYQKGYCYNSFQDGNSCNEIIDDDAVERVVNFGDGSAS